VQERSDELDRQETGEDEADDSQEDAKTCVHEDHSLFVDRRIEEEGSNQDRRACSRPEHQHLLLAPLAISRGDLAAVRLGHHQERPARRER
jgi:hypothetical protein